MMYPGHEETVDSHDLALTGFVPVTESPSQPAFWGQSEGARVDGNDLIGHPPAGFWALNSLPAAEIRNRRRGPCGRTHHRPVVDEQRIICPGGERLHRQAGGRGMVKVAGPVSAPLTVSVRSPDLSRVDEQPMAVSTRKAIHKTPRWPISTCVSVQGQNVTTRSSAGLPSDGPVLLHPDPGRLQHWLAEPPQMSLQAIVLPQLSFTRDAAEQPRTSVTHSWLPQAAPSTRRATLYPPRKPRSRTKMVALAGN